MNILDLDLHKVRKFSRFFWFASLHTDQISLFYARNVDAEM